MEETNVREGISSIFRILCQLLAAISLNYCLLLYLFLSIGIFHKYGFENVILDFTLFAVGLTLLTLKLNTDALQSQAMLIRVQYSTLQRIDSRTEQIQLLPRKPETSTIACGQGEETKKRFAVLERKEPSCKANDSGELAKMYSLLKKKEVVERIITPQKEESRPEITEKSPRKTENRQTAIKRTKI